MDKTIHTERKGVDRINSFSDAVFAVAITLLILTIGVPDVAEPFTEQALLDALGDMWHNFSGYILSFIIVGMFWMRHHYLFVRLEKHNRGLMWLNHLFLMVIVFLPFPTEMMSTYPQSKVATAIYAASMAVCGLLAAALWWYATVHYEFANGSIGRAQKKDATFSFLGMSAVFLLSLALVPFSPSAAKYSWIAILPIEMFIGRKYREKEEREERDAPPVTAGEG